MRACCSMNDSRKRGVNDRLLKVAAEQTAESAVMLLNTN